MQLVISNIDCLLSLFIANYIYEYTSSQLEKDVEERFRAKYTLVDKTDPAAIAAAQAAGIPIGDDGELVGEPDGSGFGVGQAPSNSKPVASSVVNAKKKERGRGSKSKERGRYEIHLYQSYGCYCLIKVDLSVVQFQLILSAYFSTSILLSSLP